VIEHPLGLALQKSTWAVLGSFRLTEIGCGGCRSEFVGGSLCEMRSGQPPIQIYDGACMTATEIKTLLQLVPHPSEGGSFRRTYVSALRCQAPQGDRPVGTAIYYLLETGTFSKMHVLSSDEVFHFYLGDPVEMLQLWPSGESKVVRLGQDLAAGEQVQVVVPAGVWQGTRLIGAGKVALLGCTVAPGFDFADYRDGSFAELAAEWPDHSDRIRALTRR
jgi:uncharacterized protein